MEEEVKFLNILAPRKAECGIFRFMTRSWNPLRTFSTDKYYSPQDIKEVVAKSVFLDSFIEAESAKTGVSKEKLKREVLTFLEEMGLEKKLHVIRWMGIAFLKISFMMKVGIFVNEPAVLRIKSSMGKNPILFLPTHRSYADFCLLTYLCYHYDIELPAVAAGMDFYSMAVFGQGMRETGAFYIRRTLVGAPLYAATLKQYVRTVVAKYAAPMEFFLEGTRSRSNKSLCPKYGVLSMSLMPLFAREVTDITIVPVNISYDRLMEHGLFAYEHLGVPKPKESTGGLLKSLYRLNDHYGNIYINFGAPLSVRSYLGDISYTDELLKPVDLQQITPNQFKQVQSVADYVISLQQKATVVTITNLLALVLMNSIVTDKLLDFDEVVSEVSWMMGVLRQLGALVYENDVRSSLERILVVHREMVRLDKQGRLRLVSGTLMDVSTEVQKKMKGHILKAETMANAVPMIQLQLYVNPVMHYLVPPAVIYLVADRWTLTEEELAARYRRIRRLLHHEFYYVEESENETFESALEYCVSNGVVSRDGGLRRGGAGALAALLRAGAAPALAALHACAAVLTEEVTCAHSRALKLVQARVEAEQWHPYSLSLDSIANCLQGLVLDGSLIKEKLEKEMSYSIVPPALAEARALVAALLPARSDLSRSPVLLHPTPTAKI